MFIKTNGADTIGVMQTWRLLFATGNTFERFMGFCTRIKELYWQAETSRRSLDYYKANFKAHFMSVRCTKTDRWTGFACSLMNWDRGMWSIDRLTNGSLYTDFTFLLQLSNICFCCQ